MAVYVDEAGFAGRMIPGSPATLAATIEELVVDGGLDSIQMLFPDYINGLKILVSSWSLAGAVFKS